ncbi:MAG: hypothetical protein VYD25_05850 [Pseudomonadota bacterium]|nr:hypothetical protein [Pseudomonadota bacterium]MED5407248.1 hypothetical protein [Pseudomonadota bacterium]
MSRQAVKLLIYATGGLLMLSGCVIEPAPTGGWTKEQRVSLHTRLGIGYLQQGRLAAAQEELEFALRLGTDDSGANHAMALLKVKLGESAAADQYFLHALAGDSNNRAARNDYGMYLCDTGRVDAGIGQLEQVLKDPFNDARYRSHFGMATCLSHDKQYQAAADHLSKALEARPNNRFVLYESAVVSHELGRFLSARGYLERYFEHGTPSANSLLLAVKNELSLGSDELVQLYAYQLRSSYPSSSQAKEARSLLAGSSPDG